MFTTCVNNLNIQIYFLLVVSWRSCAIVAVWYTSFRKPLMIIFAWHKIKTGHGYLVWRKDLCKELVKRSTHAVSNTISISYSGTPGGFVQNSWPFSTVDLHIQILTKQIQWPMFGISFENPFWDTTSEMCARSILFKLKMKIVLHWMSC